MTVRSCRASSRAALYSFVTPQDGDSVFWLAFDLHTVISNRGGMPGSFRVAALSTELGFGGVPTTFTPGLAEDSSREGSQLSPPSQPSAAPASPVPKGRRKVTFLLPEEEGEPQEVPQTTLVLDVTSSGCYQPKLLPLLFCPDRCSRQRPSLALCKPQDFASDKVAELELSLEKLLFTIRLVIIAARMIPASLVRRASAQNLRECYVECSLRPIPRPHSRPLR